MVFQLWLLTIYNFQNQRILSNEIPHKKWQLYYNCLMMEDGIFDFVACTTQNDHLNFDSAPSSHLEEVATIYQLNNFFFAQFTKKKFKGRHLKRSKKGTR